MVGGWGLPALNPAMRRNAAWEVSMFNTHSLGGSLARFFGRAWPPPYDMPVARAGNFPLRWLISSFRKMHDLRECSRASAASICILPQVSSSGRPTSTAITRLAWSRIGVGVLQGHESRVGARRNAVPSVPATQLKAERGALANQLI